MYAGKEDEAVFTVKEIIIEKNRAFVETIIIDLETQKAMKIGETIIMNVLRIIF
jgi:hypothetical protein